VAAQLTPHWASPDYELLHLRCRSGASVDLNKILNFDGRGLIGIQYKLRRSGKKKDRRKQFVKMCFFMKPEGCPIVTFLLIKGKDNNRLFTNRKEGKAKRNK
jgi:hypothetical protein